MPKKPDDLSKDAFHPIDVAGAERVIAETLSGARRKLNRPMADELVEAFDAMLRDYEARRVIDVMPDLKDYDQAYDELRRASEKFRMAILKITTNHELFYFFLASMPHTERAPKPDEVLGRMLHVLERAAEVSRFAKIARKEVSSSIGEDGNRRWYELVEGRATNWLYGTAISDLFEKLFKARYSIGHEQASTSPGQRFALSLLAAAGLPTTSRSNLLGRLRIARGQHPRIKVADGIHN